MTMIFTLTYILLAGILIQNFYTHFFSEKRNYFSFDDRRFTDDDYLKVQNLGIGKIERIFLIIMLVLSLMALSIHLFFDPVLSIWAIVSVVGMLLILNVIVDLKLYTVTYSKSHLLMAGFWLVIIIGGLVAFWNQSVDDVDVEFDTDGIAINDEPPIPFDDIDRVEMTSEAPEIPFNHNLFGTHLQLHGFIEGEEALYDMNIEDRTSDMLVVVTGNIRIYLNDRNGSTTNEWYENLKEKTE